MIFSTVGFMLKSTNKNIIILDMSLQTYSPPHPRVQLANGQLQYSYLDTIEIELSSLKPKMG